MRRLALAASLTLALAAASPAAADEQIVVLDDTNRATPTEIAEREQALGFDVDFTYDRALDGFAADLTPEQVAALERDPEVAIVTPNRPVRAAALAAADDTKVPPGVHRVTQTLAGQVREAATGAVAVLDTGIDLAHPDLNAVAGTNCISPGAAPQDANGHGTHVAGTIGARNDGQGVTGVAPGTKLVAVKVLDDSGDGSTASILCGIDWVRRNAAAHGITVANFSLGGYGPRSTCKTDAEHAAFCQLAVAGVTPVVAAGNAGVDFAAANEVPASYPQVLTVAAMADSDGRPGGTGARMCGVSDDRYAPFSNYASNESDAAHLVAAPGVCIKSTWPGNRYEYESGTSMATPHVAGLVALCKGEAGGAGPCAGLSTPQVIARMRVPTTWSLFTGLTGRLFGPLAVLSDPATPTPRVDDALLEQPEQPPTQPPAGQPDDGSDGAGTPPPANPAPAPAPAPRPAPVVPRPVTTPLARPALRLTTPTLGVLRTRGLTAKLTCPRACTATIRLTVSRSVAKKLRLKSTTLATARARRAGTVTLKLGAKARAALRRAKTLKVTLAATVDVAGTSVASTKRLTIRR